MTRGREAGGRSAPRTATQQGQDQEQREPARTVRRRATSEGPGKGSTFIVDLPLGVAHVRTKALLAGFQSHIAKPLQPAELLAAIGALTGRRAKRTREPAA